jgi:hypothetical protein
MFFPACHKSHNEGEEERSNAHLEKPSVDMSELAPNEKRHWVYIDDDALQCERPGRALAETLALLTKENIPVRDSRCASITGVMTMTLCGTKTLDIHIHQIPMTYLKKAGSVGFQSEVRSRMAAINLMKYIHVQVNKRFTLLPFMPCFNFKPIL